MRLYADYERYNPFRRPDWRWERILRMVDRHPTPGRCTKRDDEVIKQARTFALRWRARDEHERQELFYEDNGANAGLYYAYQMYERAQDRPQDLLLVQARLLAGMKSRAIAALCDTLPATIQWYEALFFNVHDKLHARDWITSQVLVPAMVRNFGLLDQPHNQQDDDGNLSPASWHQEVIARPFLDASLKMFAYFGGAAMCEFMIHSFQTNKLCKSPDDIPRWLDEHWATTIRARSAQAARTFTINKFNVMELFATHTRIIEIERAEDSSQLQRNVIERHVGALLDEITWPVGAEESPGLAGTDVPKYDAAAAELRDDELLLAASGQPIKGLDGLEQLSLPPRKENKPS